ncbi:MAG: DUF5686 and carboxypeptidase regulatory-like domain-containing protein [Prevotellaceae bacterium]|jgi:hypothetical protein|nr:DUF5686 and carboxypeptidase regulatory-like domain-containing protein [Prevotellaceae bacterium]
MRRPLLFCLLLIFSSLSVYSQTLKGTVVNDSGEPVSFAVMFIKELSQGAGANKDGYFEVKVKTGTYHCTFQSLGHQTLEQVVEVKPEGTELNIVLLEKPYMLTEAEVGIGKVEDPAYRIMRKAIGMAPYYLNQVSEYHSNVYLKGNLIIDNIGGIIKALAGNDINDLALKVGEEYLQESVNEVIFNAPDKYEQNVKSISSSFPESLGDLYLVHIRLNIYNTENDLYISPLSPSAFANYNFKHEGVSLEGKHVINKIKVTPKIKSKLLLEGYLCIDEDSYSIWEFDLSGSTIGIKYRNRQSFAEVREGVFLPINYLMDFKVSILGVNATIAYKSVVRYDEVKVNPNAEKFLEALPLNNTDTIRTASFQSEKVQSLNREIEELMSKDKFTNRDAAKLSNLMSKSMKEARKANMAPEEKKKDPLEITDNLKLNVDSLAKKQDSAYWAAARPIPLSVAERESYLRKDSLRRTEVDSTGKRLRKSFAIEGLIMGKRYYLCDSSARINHEGLASPYAMYFNPVDGFTYGQELSFYKRFKDTTSFRATLKGRYAFKREVLMGGLALTYSYWPEQRASLAVEGGWYSTDFNENGVLLFENTYAALFAHSNYINLYDNKYIDISHSIDIANGLTFKLRGTFSDRSRLENTTNYSFFARSRDYKSNDPDNPYVAIDPNLVADARSAVIRAVLSYTPQYYYRKYGRIKRMMHSSYPTFTIGWKKGIPDVFDSTSDFDMGIVSIQQPIDMGIFKSFSYKLEGAKFFNRKEIHFADFRHFTIEESMFLFGNLSGGSFYLPETYSASTNEWYLLGTFEYRTPYLLLKYLPFLNNTYWQEGLQLSYLRTPYVRNYTEVGYSLTGIGLLFGVGVYVGFDDFKYNNVGVRFSMGLNPFRR